MPKWTNKPIIPMDFPDPDVIRVDDTYYMMTTTMHFFPGGEILQSHDLVHWEHASFVFEKLDSTNGQMLEATQNIYGSGMWAGSLRYHAGLFHVVFIANDTHSTYHFTAEKITGPWRRRRLEGFYYDCSLFFDDDGRTFIVHGNTEIKITELNEELTAPNPSGIDRVIVRDDPAQVDLGYEGAHLYKVNGRYALFLIHWPTAAPNRRTEACFISDSIEGPFRGKDVFNDDMGFKNSGVAQGGIVDDGLGNWYAILFQDRGALGRMPVLIPLKWDEDGFPHIGENGKVPETFETVDLRLGSEYQPLVASDDFESSELLPQWQWNHEPSQRNRGWKVGQGRLSLTSEKLSPNVIYAKNTLTTRTVFPYCRAEVTLDATLLNPGDRAGMVALLSSFGTVELHRDLDGLLHLEMCARPADNDSLMKMAESYEPAPVVASLPWEDEQSVRVGITFDSRSGRDFSTYWYEKNGSWKKLGEHELFWKMDHFTGCRVGLFLSSEKVTGGSASFSHFNFSVQPA